MRSFYEVLRCPAVFRHTDTNRHEARTFPAQILSSKTCVKSAINSPDVQEQRRRFKKIANETTPRFRTN